MLSRERFHVFALPCKLSSARSGSHYRTPERPRSWPILIQRHYKIRRMVLPNSTQQKMFAHHTRMYLGCAIGSHRSHICPNLYDDHLHVVAQPICQSTPPSQSLWLSFLWNFTYWKIQVVQRNWNWWHMGLSASGLCWCCENMNTINKALKL
jgi:hypothetical protein